MPRNLLLAALALRSATVSAQTVNTQLSGFTFTNGIGALTDTSGLNNGVNVSTGITYLTDNDISTFTNNIGQGPLINGTQYPGGGSIQGTFSGAIDASATGIFIIPLLAAAAGTFDLQLVTSSGLTASRAYGDADYVLTEQLIGTIDAFVNTSDTVMLDVSAGQLKYTYLYVSFTDFGVVGSEVIGVKLQNFTSQYLDASYIGAGYFGGPPVPEPSTYGLALGGLALAVVAARRRKMSK